MKIFCPFCKNHILDTSDAFKLGGPYNGAMFQRPPHRSNYWGQFFRFVDSVRFGNLVCPRCGGQFIKRDGSLLTEHGVVAQGQEVLDTYFSILDGEGQVCRIESSKTVPFKTIVDTYLLDYTPKEAETGGYPCPECPKVCKSLAGLRGHMRVHA